MAQGFTRKQVQSILDDVTGSELIDEGTRRLLVLAEKVTKRPYAVAPEDIQALRDIGLDDAAILEGLHVMAFYNYMDRMADATGAPTDGFMAMVEKKSARKDG